MVGRQVPDEPTGQNAGLCGAEHSGVTAVDTGLATRLVDNVKRVIRGKDGAVEEVVVGLLAGGHVLIEDIPGVGKTMLGKALALSIGGSFNRIQFTADLLPSDVTGVSLFNQKTQEFEFLKGPIFAAVVLADEINRGTPRAQSSLLECMNEHQVTTDQGTFTLPSPFMVLGTQNPIEFEGTYPLLEAQLDRFLLCVHLGYPDPAAEIEILKSQAVRHPVEQIKAVAAPEEIVEAQEQVRRVEVSDPIYEYIVDIASWTRDMPDIELGVSPRGTLSLRRAAQALAALRGRDYVIPDDVKRLARAVLAHRLILRLEAELSGLSKRDLMQQCLEEVEIRVGE